MEEVLKLLNEDNSVQENLQILNEQLKGKLFFLPVLVLKIK
jgi:hypothetical protein